MTVCSRVPSRQEGAACFPAWHTLLALLVWVCLVYFFFPLDYFSASEFPVTDTRCAGDEQCRNTRRDETEKKHLFCALSFVLGVSSVGCLTW